MMVLYIQTTHVNKIEEGKLILNYDFSLQHLKSFSHHLAAKNNLD